MGAAEPLPYSAILRIITTSTRLAKNPPADQRRVLASTSGDVMRPRAADDFDAIRQRLKELRRQSAPQSGEASAPARSEPHPNESERRRQDRRDGLPPPWVPTIFLKKVTDIDSVRGFWHTRSGS